MGRARQRVRATTDFDWIQRDRVYHLWPYLLVGIVFWYFWLPSRRCDRYDHSQNNRARENKPGLSGQFGWLLAQMKFQLWNSSVPHLCTAALVCGWIDAIRT
jgi:hypothetical protein